MKRASAILPIVSDLVLFFNKLIVSTSNPVLIIKFKTPNNGLFMNINAMEKIADNNIEI